jgi:hypothetical protein
MKTLSDYPFLVGEVLKRAQMRERRKKALKAGMYRLRRQLHLAPAHH